jgi:hypothetical protein
MLRSARIEQTISQWFEERDATRDLDEGRIDFVRVGDITIGRVTCFPGWRWSTHLYAALRTSTHRPEYRVRASDRSARGARPGHV